MSNEFRVVISGQTLSGAPLATVRDSVGQVFRLSGAQLDQMLSGTPQVVAKQTTAEGAEKLIARLAGLDLAAKREALAVPPTSFPAATSNAADELFALGPPPALPASTKVFVRPLAEAGSPLAIADGEDTICPKCGAVQPKRNLCRACGLDMPRFIAAQEAARQEAQAEREEAVGANVNGRGQFSHPPQGRAAWLGFRWDGRFGRLDYLGCSLLGGAVALLSVLVALKSGALSLVWLGAGFWTLLCFRGLALRLHDTGRTGWLSLLALVPVVGGLMSLILLFVPGDDDENDYGFPPEARGGAVLAVLVISIFLCTTTFRMVTGSPQMLLKFLQATSFGKDDETALASPDELKALPTVRYAESNRIDLYVMSGCDSCDQLRSWLDENGLRYTLYFVDRDENAGQRLHSIIGNGGRIQLPVVEVNGTVLPGNPSIGDLHRQLRQMPHKD